MEYAEGETLSAFLERKGTLTEAELKAILYPILDGLEAVHRADFLHRDIKLGNIVIRDEDNSPVLLDFGSVRQAMGARSRSVTSIITPGYAPIEQYSSRGDQGTWTDIYALGSVCYRALTGEVPDDATDRMRDDPLIPVVERCAGQASTGFLSAIDWALAVDEGDRPQSIAEWRTKLEGEHVVHSPSHEESSISVASVERLSTPSAVSQSATPESEQQGKRRSQVLLSVLGVCLLLAGLGGYLWWSKKNHEAEVVRYVAQFEEALGRKDFSMADIYVDSIRVIDSDAPVLSELEGRLSAARQAERRRQEQAEKRRQEQAALYMQRQAFVAKVGRRPYPSGVNNKGETDLHIATELNLPVVIISLLNQGADANAKDKNGYTPLSYAAFYNAREAAEVLLRYRADANAKNNSGNMPLHLAAQKNAHKTAEVLIKYGADANARNKDSLTPLHATAIKNTPEAAEVLLRYRADVNAKTIDGRTPLGMARVYGSRETIELLRRYGGREE